MKRMKTILGKMLSPALFMILVMAMGMTARAELAAPKIVKITAEESSITLKYSKVSGADGYAIYIVNPETGEKLIDTPINKSSMSRLKNSSSAKISGLTNNKTYAFKIAAVDGEEIGALSNMMSAKPAVTNPGAMVNARVSAYGNKSVTLSWTKLKNATGYIIYQRKSDGTYKELTRVTDGSKTSYAIKGLKNEKVYYFKLAAYRTVDDITVIGSKSAKLKGTPSKTSAAAKAVHTYYYQVRLRQTAKAQEVNGTGTITLKKGTTIKVTKKVKSYATGTSYFTKNGVKYKIPSQYLNYDSYSFITTSTAYTKSVAEEFVNYKGYSSQTKWLIWISTYSQRLYLFKGSQGKWKLQRAMLCSTGAPGTFKDFKNPSWIRRGETPLGSCNLGSKQHTWIFAVNQYAYYASRIIGGAIHSELYYPATMTKWTILGKLGKPASHGCVRVEISNAKYIYDYIPSGTKVVIY